MISPEVLRRYPYFAAIREESLKEVAMLADECRLPADFRVFSEGDPARYMYIIMSGEVNIQYELGSGELRTVDTLVPGDLLVWSALVEPYKTTAIGITTKPCELVRIAAEPLRTLCERDPRVGYQLVVQVAKLLAHRLEMRRVQLASMD